MDEKRISVKEFDAAVEKVLDKIFKEESLKGAAKVMIPLMGASFAGSMRKVLFEEEQNND